MFKPNQHSSDLEKILANFLEIAVDNGWNELSLDQAIIDSGFDLSEKSQFFNKIDDLTGFFIENGNQKFVGKVDELALDEMKIRDKIKELVKARLLIEKDNKKALKALFESSKNRKIAVLLKSSYQISDLIWNLAGDQSNDFNFYSKRLILAKVFSRVSIVFSSDNSPENEKSWAVLDKEIAQVMNIQKAKIKIKNCIEKIPNLSQKANHSACNLKEKIKKLPFIRLIKPRKFS